MPRGRPKTVPPADTNRLQELRLRAGLTQQQLADLVRTQASTIYKLEAGKRALTEDKVLALARALDVHPGELFAPLPPPGLQPYLQEAAAILAAMDEEQRSAWTGIGRAVVAGRRSAPRAKSSA